MSIDLRNKYKKDDKITMLNKHINKYHEHINVPYITENNYYEIKIDKFELDGEFFDNQPLTVMLDSGTTFSHFPDHVLKDILNRISIHCR